MQVKVLARNRIRIEPAVRAGVLHIRVTRCNPAVDHDMRDMNILRGKLARHALRERTQRELAHGERGGLRIGLEARGGPGKQDGAAAVSEHSYRRLLSDQETAKRADF